MANILSMIPIPYIMNVVLLMIIFSIITLNPYGFNFMDVMTWIKLKISKNASIHRIIFPDGTEKEYIIKKVEDTITTKYGGKQRVFILNKRIATRRGNTLVFTHNLDNVEGIDYFNEEENKKFSATKFDKVINLSKAANVDIISFLNKYKDFGKYALMALLVLGAIAYFTYQSYTIISTVKLCQLDPSVLIAK